MLFAELSWDEHGLVIALQLGRDASYGVCVSAGIFLCNQALLQFDLTSHLQVEATLVHDNVETGQVFVAEVQTWLGHHRVDHFLEQVHVCRCIPHNALHKLVVAICTAK